MKNLKMHTNITAPLLIMGVLYYLCSILYHQYALIDDKYWDCFFFIKDAILIFGLIYIVYKSCLRACDIFMVLSIGTYKLITLIADLWCTVNSNSFEECGLLLFSWKLTIPLSVGMALILLLIIKIYRLWTK